MAGQICREHIWTALLARREKDRSPFQSSLRDDLWRVDVSKPVTFNLTKKMHPHPNVPGIAAGIV